LKKKYDDAQKLVEKRQEQAEQAVAAGDDDLARRALEDKNKRAEQADSFREAWEHAKEDSSTLRHKLEDMKEEYEEMKMKKDSLKARAESAKARTKINRTMSGFNSDDSKAGFERMEEKVLRYEADTSEDMRSSNRSLDEEFEKLNKKSGVDDELAALKKKMGKE
jgi:phage shock protein A